MATMGVTGWMRRLRRVESITPGGALSDGGFGKNRRECPLKGAARCGRGGIRSFCLRSSTRSP